MKYMSDPDNIEHAQRHAKHALEDFNVLREDRNNESLWHSLSHHLQHAAYRLKKERLLTWWDRRSTWRR